MASVVLSIVLVVLLSAAVLWVVDGERPKPTSAPSEPLPPGPVAPVAPPVVPRRQPATSRGRPPAIVAPAPIARPTTTATVAVAEAPPRVTAVRLPGPPLPRRRFRSTLLLVLLVVVVGVTVAAVVGAIVTALAFALRAAVTS